MESIFYNSDYIVIEYIDLIKSPYLILLNLIRQNPKLKQILKIEQIEFLDDASLYEWYINIKHLYFFIDLNKYPDLISNEQLYEILDDQLASTPIMHEEAVLLPLTDMLKVLSKRRLVNDIIIYYPHNNDFAKKDLEYSIGVEYTFMNDFEEVLKKCGANSTYFLSDINKINIMKEKGVLNFSSITLPIEYRYNKKNMEEMKIDLDELLKDHPFKLSYTRACTFEDHRPEEVREEEEFINEMMDAFNEELENQMYEEDESIEE